MKKLWKNQSVHALCTRIRHSYMERQMLQAKRDEKCINNNDGSDMVSNESPCFDFNSPSTFNIYFCFYIFNSMFNVQCSCSIFLTCGHLCLFLFFFFSISIFSQFNSIFGMIFCVYMCPWLCIHQLSCSIHIMFILHLFFSLFSCLFGTGPLLTFHLWIRKMPFHLFNCWFSIFCAQFVCPSFLNISCVASFCLMMSSCLDEWFGLVWFASECMRIFWS